MSQIDVFAEILDGKIIFTVRVSRGENEEITSVAAEPHGWTPL